MTNSNPPSTRRSITITAICLAYTIAGYFITFGLSFMCGNTYAQVLIQGGGFSGTDQTSHDIFVATGAIVGCLIGGFVTVAFTPSPTPEQPDQIIDEPSVER